MLALALVAIAGIAATRLPWQSWRRSPNRDLVLATGLPLVLTGVLLGPGLGVLDGALLRALAPVTALAIGWLGAVFGARLEWRVVRRISRADWGLGTVRAAVTFALVALAAWSLSRARPALGSAWAPTLPGLLTLGALAVVSGPGAVAQTAQPAGISRRGARACRLAATLDTLLGALAFTLTLALYHPRVPVGGATLGWLRWLALASGSGVLVGMLFISVSRLRSGRDDLGLALSGVVLFGAGVGYAADLSPFVVCTIAAVVIVNLSPHRRRVQELLLDWAHPIYAVILIIVGALLVLPTAWLLLAIPLLAAVGIAAKWGAARAALRWLRVSGWPANVGVATAASGGGEGEEGVALALALNFHLTFQGAGAGGILTTITLGVILAQLAAPRLITHTHAPAPLTPPPQAPEVTG